MLQPMTDDALEAAIASPTLAKWLHQQAESSIAYHQQQLKIWQNVLEKLKGENKSSASAVKSPTESSSSSTGAKSSSFKPSGFSATRTPFGGDNSKTTTATATPATASTNGTNATSNTTSSVAKKFGSASASPPADKKDDTSSSSSSSSSSGVGVSSKANFLSQLSNKIGAKRGADSESEDPSRSSSTGSDSKTQRESEPLVHAKRATVGGRRKPTQVKKLSTTAIANATNQTNKAAEKFVSNITIKGGESEAPSGAVDEDDAPEELVASSSPVEPIQPGTGGSGSVAEIDEIGSIAPARPRSLHTAAPVTVSVDPDLPPAPKNEASPRPSSSPTAATESSPSNYDATRLAAKIRHRASFALPAAPAGMPQRLVPSLPAQKEDNDTSQSDADLPSSPTGDDPIDLPPPPAAPSAKRQPPPGPSPSVIAAAAASASASPPSAILSPGPRKQPPPLASVTSSPSTTSTPPASSTNDESSVSSSSSADSSTKPRPRPPPPRGPQPPPPLPTSSIDHIEGGDEDDSVGDLTMNPLLTSGAVNTSGDDFAQPLPSRARGPSILPAGGQSELMAKLARKREMAESTPPSTASAPSASASASASPPVQRGAPPPPLPASQSGQFPAVSPSAARSSSSSNPPPRVVSKAPPPLTSPTAAATPSASSAPCGECGCLDFQPDTFKKAKCRNCFHVHS